MRKLPNYLRVQSNNDKVIMVPIPEDDIVKNVTSLPRTSANDGYIVVNLKRMKSIKKPYMQEELQPEQLLAGLEYLRQNHPDYKDVVPIDVIQEFIDIDDEDISSDDICESDENERFDSDNSSDEDDQDEKVNDNVFCSVTCLMPENPTAQVLVNDTDKVIEKKTRIQSKITTNVAPGESKTPTNYMREENFLETAFPRHFPDGKYGLFHNRPKKITPQQYFNQRLLNVDKRFSSDYGFLFVAQQYTERHAIERNISICMKKGKMVEEPDGKIKVTQPNDKFNVLKTVRGTPPYWQQMRYDIFAKLEQLGPFHLFFTLSCAEMRWPEIMAAVLEKNGHRVEFISNPWNGEESDILIDDMPLPEFKKTISSMSSFYQEHIVLLTLMFENRVKAFLKCILNEDVEHYTYRIEWQLRGMPHLHGIIWLKKSSIGHLLNSEGSFDVDDKSKEEDLIKFIEKWTSCSLDTGNEKLDQIVKDVNVHVHKETCKKHQTKCRFGFPRFPSNETIIARPLPSDMDEKEKKEKLEKAKEILTRVKDHLEFLMIDYTEELNDFLARINITPQDYTDALRISEKGITIILKRKISEVFVNNYNPDFLIAWNGNIDVQFCSDPYAVTSYITDYITKPDAGLTKVLKEALKESKDFDDFNRMLHLKRVYMTHRQVSASEAVYRLFRHLHMKYSTIQTEFVSTNFPEDRTAFFARAKDQTDDQEIDSDDENESNDNGGQLLSVVGYKGKFQKAQSKHEKYALRPDELKDICLAQFATTYVTCQKKNIELKGMVSEEVSEVKHFMTQENLPKFIRLKDGKILEARNTMKVLRLHNVRNKIGHEEQYALLLLFLPWQDEEKELKYQDSEACIQVLTENSVLVEENRKAMLPYSNFKKSIETLIANEERAVHVFESINAQNEQENLEDANDAEPLDMEELPQEKDEGNFAAKINSDSYTFKPIQFGSDEDMIAAVESFSYEQRLAFDIYLQYCKKKKFQRANPSMIVLPELATITGRLFHK